MASVKLNIVDLSDPAKIFQQSACKGAITKEAQKIASKANAMSASFRTELYYQPGSKEPQEDVGNKRPRYAALNARNSKDGCIAIVTEKNYSAMKDNHLHNTLKKAGGV